MVVPQIEPEPTPLPLSLVPSPLLVKVVLHFKPCAPLLLVTTSTKVPLVLKVSKLGPLRSLLLLQPLLVHCHLVPLRLPTTSSRLVVPLVSLVLVLLVMVQVKVRLVLPLSPGYVLPKLVLVSTHLLQPTLNHPFVPMVSLPLSVLKQLVTTNTKLPLVQLVSKLVLLRFFLPRHLTVN